MKEVILKRTKQIGLDVIKLVNDFPNMKSVNILSGQILRSSTSIGANYRAACRAKSNADFINKLKIVEEETDETIYWLEVFIESGIIEKQKVEYLIKECNEILSIVVASINTVRVKINQK